MNNKQVLEFIKISDGLLSDYGNALRIEGKKLRKKTIRKIFNSANKLQNACIHPYVMASNPLGTNEVEYTCLVCGRIMNNCAPEKVINITENGLIEGDVEEEYAVSELKKYLEAEPALSEVEIREALRKDLTQEIKQR